MISLDINDIKQFMNQLLLGHLFDQFLFVEGTITTSYTVTLDGHLQRDFFSADELELLHLDDRTYVYWSEIQPLCLQIIRGKKTPLNFQFILSLSKEDIQEVIQLSGLNIPESSVQGLYLHLRFHGKELKLVTGCSLSFFSLDRTLEHTFDHWVQHLFPDYVS